MTHGEYGDFLADRLGSLYRLLRRFFPYYEATYVKWRVLRNDAHVVFLEKERAVCRWYHWKRN
jgi:hypothetical protein